jgi:hypothetical protein
MSLPSYIIMIYLSGNLNRYGCPGVEEIERFNRLYKQKLDEIIERGEIPLDLAVEVSHPIVYVTARMQKLDHRRDSYFGCCRFHHQVLSDC